MCAQWFTYVSRSTMFRLELDRLEVTNVICGSLSKARTKLHKQLTKKNWKSQTWIEEHVSHGCRFFVHLEWMTAENDTLRDNPGCIWIQEATHTHQLWSCWTENLFSKVSRRYNPWCWYGKKAYEIKPYITKPNQGTGMNFGLTL